jgi:hypothetical protein
VLAGASGVLLGVAIAWSPVLASALVPFLVFVNTLPKVAVAPLFLLWLGYGMFPNMLIGALIGFFPVVINTAVGLTQVDPEMLDLGRVFNAPKWKVFAKIRVPNAYPYILSALRVTATAAVVGVIVGEFVASQGFGYVIITTRGSTNTPVASRRWHDLGGRPRRTAGRPGSSWILGQPGLKRRGSCTFRIGRRAPHGLLVKVRPWPRRRLKRSSSRSTGSRSVTMRRTGSPSTRATTRPKVSTSSCRTRRVRATRSPRWTRAAPTSASLTAPS